MGSRRVCEGKSFCFKNPFIIVYVFLKIQEFNASLMIIYPGIILITVNKKKRIIAPFENINIIPSK